MSMYFRNILVPYDESDHALSALHTALAMVGDEPDAKVHVVTIIPARALPGVPFTGDGFDVSPTVVNPESYDQLMDVLVSRTRTDLQQVVKESLDGARCKVSVDAVIDASPVEGIANYVENNNIDLVVMGRRGVGALRGMLGSVSYGVLRSVDVPILTVK
ncbi:MULTISPECIES: universal stress protein [Enorma]|mgnify:CR=1 FL=1|uniref:UspA domain-containing protein n=1 Tax=[Collinsella] massiliensis TaxID=1232426 RepID=A0A1Y3XWX6_9ACTN|nr:MULTISPECIES: universal stress protein [Enorma]OUN88808.1 hypothetical protein B5G02_04375 [[Collinsella] massiliensis]